MGHAIVLPRIATVSHDAVLEGVPYSITALIQYKGGKVVEIGRIEIRDRLGDVMHMSIPVVSELVRALNEYYEVE
jgi:hypothetical protein